MPQRFQCWLLLVASGVALAQIPQGSIIGTVGDSSGARIAGASVSASAIGFPLERKASSNQAGEFRFDSLPPGDYRVTANAPNFATAVAQIKVSVSAAPSLSLTL